LASDAATELVISTRRGDETRDLARKLGLLLQPGDVIALSGDLGAGKTTFTQGLAVGLGIEEGVVVNSPTFTILAEHHEGRMPLYHFDVYRLSGPGDLYDLAFDEYLDGSGVTVIEWADKIEAALPPDTLYISIAFANSRGAMGPTSLTAALSGHVDQDSVTGFDDRGIRFRSTGPRSEDIIDRLSVEVLA